MIVEPSTDVLLIDDDPAVRRSLGRALESAGYGVHRAGHGGEALQHIDEVPFAAVVCDLMMPVMDGIRLYEELANAYPEAAARVLFITGWAQDERIQHFLQATDRPVLIKPFELLAFLAAVDRVARGDDTTHLRT